MSEYTNDFYMQLSRVNQTTILTLAVGAKAILELTQFLMRLHREGILSGGEVENYNQFVKATGGKYDIYNIPVKVDEPRENQLTAIRDKLDQMKVRYHVLPDLEGEEPGIQVCVYKEDLQKFQQFFSGYIGQTLSGGELELDDLRNFTNGKTSIISIPDQAIEPMKDAMENLKVDFADLPDLNLKDGEHQYVISNTSVQSMKEIYRLYREGLMKDGVRLGDLRVMESPEEYQATARRTEADYRKNAGEKAQKASKKYEGIEPTAKELAIAANDNEIRPSNSFACGSYLEDENYLKLSIDDASLVHNPKDRLPQQMEEKYPEYFFCRIPGTYGDNEQVLGVPKSQVFEVKDADRRRYFVFVHKEDPPMVFTPGGREDHKAYTTGEALYQRFDRNQQTPGKAKPSQSKAKNNHFHNFDQRDYDFKELENLLLGNKASGVTDVPVPPKVR